jgi:predicted ribosomally synthesized peptide with SipW-like signal peptide
MRLSAALSSTAAKVCASVVLVGGAASVAGLGTYGSFTSTTTASESVSSGKVELTLGNPALGTTVAATNLVPGDYVQRAITLNRSTDSEKFGGVTMTTTSSATPTVLTTDATNGLQLTVEQCSTSWVQEGKTLKCGGNLTNLVASRPVIGKDVALASGVTDTLNSTTAPTAFLRVTVTLPTTADNTFQSKSDGVSFAFTATQRAGNEAR